MAVVNIPFDLKPEIQAGLISGEFKLYGGVVRNQGGQIVCFLPEALNVAEANESVASNAASIASATSKASTSVPILINPATIQSGKMPSLFGSIGQFATVHPVATVITAGVVGAGLGVGIGYLINKVASKKIIKAEKKKADAATKRFNESLDRYGNALRIGELNQSIVMDLMSAIDDMRVIISSGIVKIELSAVMLGNLLGIFSFFTKEFADANDYKYEEPGKPDNNDICSNLLCLKDYLEIQKEIYSAA